MESLQVNETPSTARIAMRYGLIAGLIMIIYTAVMQMTDFIFNPAAGYLTWIVSIGVSVWAIRAACLEFRKENKGILSLGQAIGVGTLLSVISGFMGGIYQTIYVNLIDTTFTERLLDNTRSQLEKQGKLSDSDIDTAMEVTQKIVEFTQSFSFIINPIMGGIFGLIVSLIVGAVLKRDANPFQAPLQQDMYK